MDNQKENALLSIREAAAQLGKIAESTVRSWIYQGRLPIVNLGRRVFIHSETIEAVQRLGLDAVDPQKNKSSLDIK
ncbi:helix-turn-helix domain-containing protein [bacterium]|nr:helix-turn-helix domain-containing protein [bacterium]